MVTSFYDSRGNIRYHLGAQVDVSGLLKECAGLGSSIRELVTRRRGQSETYARYSHHEARDLRASKGVLGVLAEMFTFSELKIAESLGTYGALLGVNVWMVVIVDGEEKQKLSSAPPTGLSNIEKIRLFDLRAGIENRSTSTTSDEAQLIDTESIFIEHGGTAVPGPSQRAVIVLKSWILTLTQ
ncbi:hypothetical protein NPX13_g7334 [Xylaria arbuscula]|uniref:Uncharacterized protein n=1 Tax=Xylaria arbuscula TaxID=114810 RepID=A0A9W8NAV8_9PEZI|nr:hypothetical protein NPX13_g7334 [Xylaria arbuscula]